MANLPHFLTRLSLDRSADERAVRRAYARELKLIDQDVDAAGFQVLREAYETALQWARHQARHQVGPQPRPTPEPAAARSSYVPAFKVDVQYATAPSEAPAATGDEPAASAPAGEGKPPRRLKQATGFDTGMAADRLPDAAPDVVARTMFAEFIERFRSVTATHAVNDAFSQQALRRSLDDPRLINIAARDLFEHHVAQLLADGWQPGHEALLVAAVKLFGWGEDRRRLGSHGGAGQIINRAIDERNLFDRQANVEKRDQAKLIARLRKSTPPSHRELLKKMWLLDLVTSRYPTWLALITDVNQAQEWRRLEATVPNWRRLLAFQPSVKKQDTPQSGRRWMLWIGCIWLAFIVVCAMFAKDPPHSPPPSLAISKQVEQLLNANAALSPPGSHTEPALTDPRGGRPVPPPLSKKQLAAAVKGKPTAAKCSEVARLAYDYGMGTSQPDAKLGAPFDRQVIACVLAKHWPRPLHDDPAVTAAIANEKARLADMKDFNPSMQIRGIFSPDMLKQPSPAPAALPKPAQNQYQLDYQDPAPNRQLAPKLPSAVLHDIFKSVPPSYSADVAGEK